MSKLQPGAKLSWLNLSDFAQAYVDAMLWSTTDDLDQPRNERFSWNDFTVAAKLNVIRDCEHFLLRWSSELTMPGALLPSGGEWRALRVAGCDFWLTRNRHGMGFWAGGWTEPLASILTTECSNVWGQCDVGDYRKKILLFNGIDLSFAANVASYHSRPKQLEIEEEELSPVVTSILLPAVQRPVRQIIRKT